MFLPGAASAATARAWLRQFFHWQTDRRTENVGNTSPWPAAERPLALRSHWWGRDSGLQVTLVFCTRHMLACNMYKSLVIIVTCFIHRHDSPWSLLTRAKIAFATEMPWNSLGRTTPTAVQSRGVFGVYAGMRRIPTSGVFWQRIVLTSFVIMKHLGRNK